MKFHLEDTVSRTRKALRWFGVSLAFLAVTLGALAAYVEWTARRRWDAPYPPIHADSRPEALARGRIIFEVKCAGCHLPPNGTRAIGRHMEDLPPALGLFYSANLTRDAVAGAGARSDAEIARAVRYGVTHDGRRSIMGWALSDDDLGAVIGFMRSRAPLFEPDSTAHPHSKPSFLGKAILAFVIGGPRPLPAHGIVAPPKTDPVKYGEYLAKAVYECADCHTAGFSPSKADRAAAFRGGMEFVGTDGKKLYSRNLTFHSTGLAEWTFEQFRTALKDGITPRAEPLRAPMPRFRALDDDELRAIYAFLKSLPPGESRVREAQRPPMASAEPRSPSGASALFAKAGCTACHGVGMVHRVQVIAAKGKDSDALARWIRTPEELKPGTQMPSFKAVLSEEEARTLGVSAWARAS